MAEVWKIAPHAASHRVATILALLAACVVWAVALTNFLWCDTQPSYRESLGDPSVLAAGAAERSIPFDAVGLVTGAVTGIALTRGGQMGRWLTATFGVWMLVMVGNCTMLVMHLFMMCLPLVYMLGIIAEMKVAG